MGLNDLMLGVVCDLDTFGFDDLFLICLYFVFRCLALLLLFVLDCVVFGVVWLCCLLCCNC